MHPEGWHRILTAGQQQLPLLLFQILYPEIILLLLQMVPVRYLEWSWLLMVVLVAVIPVFPQIMHIQHRQIRAQDNTGLQRVLRLVPGMVECFQMVIIQQVQGIS